MTPPPRILIAEDDDDMRAFVAAVLRDAGHEVLEARDGRELFWHARVVGRALLERRVER